MYTLFALQYKKIFVSVFLVCVFSLCVQFTSAESMSGGSYTLNGSVQVITNQGQGGSYNINPSGDPIQTTNSSGGPYTLYPSGYSREASPSRSTETLTLMLGSQEDLAYTHATSSFFPLRYIEEPTLERIRISDSSMFESYDIGRGIVVNGTYGGYDFGGEKRAVFGEKTFTEKVKKVAVLTTQTTLIWIILIGLCIIALHVWKKYHENR